MSGVRVATPVDDQTALLAWARLDILYREQPANRWVAGARAAAEWTTGVTDLSPITLERVAAAGDPLRWEGHHATMVVMGMKEGDTRFAAGAAGWLLWWTGVQPIPASLR